MHNFNCVYISARFFNARVAFESRKISAYLWPGVYIITGRYAVVTEGTLLSIKCSGPKEYYTHLVYLSTSMQRCTYMCWLAPLLGHRLVKDVTRSAFTVCGRGVHITYSITNNRLLYCLHLAKYMSSVLLVDSFVWKTAVLLMFLFYV